jgi:hypothetical protein
MTRDIPLQPKQALRLCALGELLLNGALPYGALATRVRAFTAHLVGPSVDLMGSSLELLRYEGLIAPTAGVSDGRHDEAPMAITEGGRQEFAAMMGTGPGAPLGELAKLIVTLKVRFLHLLPAERQRAVVADLIGLYEREIARLSGLRGDHAGESGHLAAWLEHDVDQYRRRLGWFRDLAARL